FACPSGDVNKTALAVSARRIKDAPSPDIGPSARRVRIGMVGGGPDAGIGPAHRYAIRLDGRYDLVAGVFSRSAEKSRHMARELGLDPSRAYASVEAMAEQ